MTEAFSMTRKPGMNQWEEVQKLDVGFQEQVANLYKNLPMELRHVLATWIESQDWETASTHEPVAVVLNSSLLTELEKQYSHHHSLLHRHMLRRIKEQLQETYKGSPLSMARDIATILSEEKRIIAMAGEMEQGSQEMCKQSSPVPERHKHIDSQVAITSFRLQRLDQEIKGMVDMQDDFDSRYRKVFSGDLANGDPECQKQETVELQMIFNELDSKRKEVLAEMMAVIIDIDVLMKSVLALELKDWKRRQQLACIGGPSSTELDQLQNWFTITAQSLFQIKRQLDKLSELGSKVTYVNDPVTQQKAQLEEQVIHLISHLIKSSFVVELQPCMSNLSQRPLIIKTMTHFSSKVRLLVRLPEVDYQLKVKISFDKDCPPQGSRHFTMLGKDEKVMDVEPSNGCLSAEFKCLELKSVNGMKGHEGFLTVTEELHAISYQAQFCMQGLTMDLETSSLPLVVISNGIQMASGWASVMWYNMLTDEPKNLSFFSSPSSSSWSQLSEVLHWQFSSSVGLGLNREQLSMLGNKLLGPQTSYNDCQVSLAMFCKEHLPKRTFSFWTWLDSILDLIKKHLQPLWMDGFIMGFVTKESEKSLLEGREVGTFLLRFSESHLGGITFTWVDNCSEGRVKLSSVVPYTKSRLPMPFANIVCEYKLIIDGVLIEPLKFLYPRTPVEEAFGKHCITPLVEGNASALTFPYVHSDLLPISILPTTKLTDSPHPVMPAGSPWSPNLENILDDLLNDNEMCNL
ncbi:signal transducer and activator of transcription 4-like isoform X2 [Conger conger]|uniref:signal transducer and activator of transcription 4-like isoform X2 n=1 Tax=Conger conger TaxID=82655 RepID=UPI002A59E06E|nr:signal transducer and activator of transcription 4-like isoform X2 [Conger conger]